MSNVTLEASTFSDQLGAYDFFNVLVSGTTFVIGLSVLNENIKDLFWNNMGIAKCAGIIALVYLAGVVLQEIGSLWDEKCKKLYTKMHRSILIGHVIDNWTNVLDNNVVENPILLQNYREYAADLMGMGPKTKENENFYKNEYVSGMLFSVSQYYIAVCGCDKKVEKMRALYNMAKTMMMTFAALTVAGILSLGSGVVSTIDFCVLVGWEMGSCSRWINKVISIICCALMTYLMYIRAKGIMKKFLLILLGTYDAIKRTEKLQKDSNVE